MSLPRIGGSMRSYSQTHFSRNRFQSQTQRKGSGIIRYSTNALSHMAQTVTQDTSLSLRTLLHPWKAICNLDSYLSEFFELAEKVREEDPAVARQSLWRIFHSYPGIIALRAHRTANYLWQIGHYDRAYYIAMKAKEKTGMEIHPGASMGKGVIADHCEAAIIGGTAIIGDYSTIHHEVTIGATGKKSDIVSETNRRHAKVGQSVSLGFGCKIFGGIEIEDNCRIGAETLIWGGPETIIGSNVHIGGKNVLRKLQIGDNSRIGSACRIIGNGKGINIGSNVSIRESVDINGSGIIIGNGVQIGKQVRIVGDNFAITENTKIPAGAVVIGHDGDYSIIDLSDKYDASAMKESIDRLEEVLRENGLEKEKVESKAISSTTS